MSDDDARALLYFGAVLCGTLARALVLDRWPGRRKGGDTAHLVALLVGLAVAAGVAMLPSLLAP